MTSSAASILSVPSHVTSIVMEYLQKNQLLDESDITSAKEKQIKREVAVYDVFAKIIIKQSVSSVIFLDIDGVLYNSSQNGFIRGIVNRLFPDSEDHSSEMHDIAATHLFSKKAVAHLEKLIKSTENVAIVISSTWREDRSVPQLRMIFSLHAFSEVLIDMTPDPKDKEYTATQDLMTDHSGRAKEIAFWLQKHPTITSYVVLDDYDNGLSDSFRNRFVKTEMSTLLTETDARKASKILNNVV